MGDPDVITRASIRGRQEHQNQREVITKAKVGAKRFECGGRGQEPRNTGSLRMPAKARNGFSPGTSSPVTPRLWHGMTDFGLTTSRTKIITRVVCNH